MGAYSSFAFWVFLEFFFSQIFLVVVGEYKNAELLDVEDQLHSIFLSSHFFKTVSLISKK